MGEGANVLTESFRRYKDNSRRFENRAWESPDWWHQRPIYQYTDSDWKKIIGLWKGEKRRGATPLYWDDVNIGDQPDPFTNAPILADITVNMMFTMPQWATDLKEDTQDPEKLKKGKCAAAHPLEGDIITNRGYVTGKYKKGDEYFVDLIWWCETFDNYIVQEGHATVRLPKKA